MRTPIASGAAAALTLALAAPLAPARTPGDPRPPEFAQHCIDHVAGIADACAARNAEFAGHCVEVIEDLLAEGHVEAALHVAARCIHRTNIRSAHCAHRIERICDYCIQVLLFLHEPQLAQLVAAACAESAQAVNESRLAAIQAILEALPDGASVPQIPPCHVDIDLDGSVGARDLLEMLWAWGMDPLGPPDMDGDGTVAGADLVTLISGWGPCPEG